MARKPSETPKAASNSEAILIRLEYAVLVALVFFGIGLFVGAKVLRLAPASGVATSVSSASEAPPSAPADPARDKADLAEVERTTDPTQLVNLGNRFFDDHRVDLSIAAYEKALKAGVKDPNVITDLGTMYRERGIHTSNEADLDKALQEFTEALRIDPKHINALFNTGVVSMDKKNTAMAVGVWKRLIQIAPNDPMAAEARKRIAEAEKKH